jgi:peptide deformylase
MNGLSDKRKQIIERIVESIVDDSQELVDDVVEGLMEEEGVGAEAALIDFYTDMAWDELYSDREDAGGEIEDQEMNDIEPVIKGALRNMSKKIEKMIQKSRKAQTITAASTIIALQEWT